MDAVAPRQPRSPLAASDLLRLVTAGSVDDGKSTLIGRLLHDSKGILEDQLEALAAASRRQGKTGVDLSLLTDGLRAEREQGITIDVAYRYFATPRRTFVIADTPGHVQYTRNMVTGASTADLAIVLIDARRGVLEQTRRHLLVAAVLRVPQVVAAVNKMDLVDWDEGAFQAIRGSFVALASRLGIANAAAIPVSALLGANVVEPSAELAWWVGPTLLDFLEAAQVDSRHDLERLRFPVQWVVRSSTLDHLDYRGHAGRLEGGILRPGDPVRVLPAGIETRIRSVEMFDGPVDEARPPMSVAVRVDDDLDLGRGAMIVGVADGPEVVRCLDAVVCWLGDDPLRIGGRYLLQHTTRVVRAVVESVQYRLDVTTLERDPAGAPLGPNDIGEVRLRLAEPIFVDAYATNRATGSAILVDESTNATVAAVVIGALDLARLSRKSERMAGDLLVESATATRPIPPRPNFTREVQIDPLGRGPTDLGLPSLLRVTDEHRHLLAHRGQSLSGALRRHLEATLPADAARHWVEALAASSSWGRVAAGLGLSLSQSVECFLSIFITIRGELAVVARQPPLDDLESPDVPNPAERAFDSLISAMADGHASARKARNEEVAVRFEPQPMPSVLPI